MSYVVNDSTMVVQPPVKLKDGTKTYLHIQPKGKVKLPSLAMVMPNDLPIRIVSESDMMGKPTADQLSKVNANVQKEGD